MAAEVAALAAPHIIMAAQAQGVLATATVVDKLLADHLANIHLVGGLARQGEELLHQCLPLPAMGRGFAMAFEDQQMA